MHMIFQMRYSFFGRSDWRAPSSKDPALLFDDARLDARHHYLERIALASLRDQTDPDFRLVVLSSDLMPESHQKRLTQVCGDILGDRAHVIFRQRDFAGAWFQRYTRRTFTDRPHTGQIILDDDDAVSADFVETMRIEGQAALLLRRGGEEYVYLSQARGISAVFRDGSVALAQRNMPANTQGLMLAAETGSKRNPFFIAHKKILERRPVRVIHGNRPFYIRSVHDSNDSRAQFSDQPVPEDQVPMLTERFPLLERLFEETPLDQSILQNRKEKRRQAV